MDFLKFYRIKLKAFLKSNLIYAKCILLHFKLRGLTFKKLDILVIGFLYDIKYMKENI